MLNVLDDIDLIRYCYSYQYRCLEVSFSISNIDFESRSLLVFISQHYLSFKTAFCLIILLIRGISGLSDNVQLENRYSAYDDGGNQRVDS